jgi:ATP-GRASP peptide maturase of grasp-with-spasm system
LIIFSETTNSLEIELINSKLKIKYKKFEIQPEEINCIWYRRWSDRNYKHFFQNPDIGLPIIDKLTNYQSSNKKELKNILVHYLKDKNWLSHPSNSSLNKLIVLTEASKLGLQIPDTKICSSKNVLINFFNTHKEIISKDLHNTLAFNDDSNFYNSVTKKVSKNFISKLPRNFTPSLFQKLIKKKYEIRSFYLDKTCYSMAIFSQNDNQTKVDFRNYNEDKPNRYVPYILPKNIELKITQLMQKLDLNTGSIDLIKDLDGNYVFLEINPVGQFGMVSEPCNYYLEKIIAEYLINK